MASIAWLSDDDNAGFPPVSRALAEPDGLLAVGGTLSPRRLITAYEHGVFPWYAEGQPVMWWSPDPRAVLFPAELRVSRSLRKRMRNAGFETRLDTAFAAVIEHCAEPRASGEGTWLTADMIAAYTELHALGLAHSVESWHDVQSHGGRVENRLGATHRRGAGPRHRGDRLPDRLPAPREPRQPFDPTHRVHCPPRPTLPPASRRIMEAARLSRVSCPGVFATAVSHASARAG
jgi:hypothetical protein